MHPSSNTRLPSGIYELRKKYFQQATAIKARIHVEVAEFGYLVDGFPAQRQTIARYYEFAHA